MPFEIIQDDIIHSGLEAIVCPSGTDMVPGGGVSYAIFNAAGTKLMRECSKIGYCPPGGAVITRGHNLKAQYVIHTVGPQWKGGTAGEEETLRNCYRSCLTLAQERRLASIAFPLISSGTYGYPKAQAIRVATEEIGGFLLTNEDMLVQLVIYDMDAYRAGSSMFRRISSYVDQHYMETHPPRRDRRAEMQEKMAQAGVTLSPLLMNEPIVARPVPVEKAMLCAFCQQPIRARARFCGYCGSRVEQPRDDDGAKVAEKLWPREAAPMPEFAAMPVACAAMAAEPERKKKTLEGQIAHLSDPFSVYLLHLIDLSGKKDSEVYKKANIDRKLFSKIRSNPNYQPKKITVIAFAIALELNLDDTQDLLQRAGFALSPANMFDLIITHFIETGNYNIFDINEALFCYDQQLLGA